MFCLLRIYHTKQKKEEEEEKKVEFSIGFYMSQNYPSSPCWGRLIFSDGTKSRVNLVCVKRDIVVKDNIIMVLWFKIEKLIYDLWNFIL